MRFPVEPDEALSALEAATLSLDGALGRLSRSASRAGFAGVEEDLGLPPGVRVPAKDIAVQLEAFSAAVEVIRPVLDQIAEAQMGQPGADVRQAALVRDVVEKATTKLAIISLKTDGTTLIDVSGLAALARQLGRMLESFIVTVAEGASRLSSWLSQEAPNWIKPLLRPLQSKAGQLAGTAAKWITQRSSGDGTTLETWVNQTAIAEPDFDLLEVERMIHRGDVPPANVIPFVTALDLRGVDQVALLTLSHLKALRKLKVARSNVSDFAPLARLAALQSLRLDHTEIDDLSPLASLTSLQSLRILGARAIDLAPLAALRALQSLEIASFQISDLSPLAGLTALQTLTLVGPLFSDLAPLAGLPALRDLELRGTKVQSLAPLRHLPNLNQISIEKDEALIETLGLPTFWAGSYFVVKQSR